MTKTEIYTRNTLTKGDIAHLCIPKDVTFDAALPQQWLREFVEWTGFDYHFVLGTTFMLYSDKRGFRQGIPWSACVEVDRLVKQFTTSREDENSPH